MSILNQPHDVWNFYGAKATYGVFDNETPVAVNVTDPPFTVNFADATHGLLSGTTKEPSLLYIEGTDNYNGLKAYTKEDANSLYIVTPFVTEALSSDTWKTKFTYDRIIPHVADKGSDIAAGPPWEFLGFVLTCGDTCDQAEDFDIFVRANIDSAFDNLIYRKAMSGVKYINNIFDKARPMGSGDKIDFVWANAGSETYGLKVYTRRLV